MKLAGSLGKEALGSGTGTPRGGRAVPSSGVSTAPDAVRSCTMRGDMRGFESNSTLVPSRGSRACFFCVKSPWNTPFLTRDAF